MIIWTKNWKTFFEKLKPKTSISCYLFFSGCNKTNTSLPERLHASLLWCKSPKELLMLLLAHQNLFPSKQPAWFLLSMSQSKALKLRKSIQHWKSTSVLCMGKLNGRNHQKVPLTVIFYAHQTKNPPKVHAWLFSKPRCTTWHILSGIHYEILGCCSLLRFLRDRKCLSCSYSIYLSWSSNSFYCEVACLTFRSRIQTGAVNTKRDVLINQWNSDWSRVDTSIDFSWTKKSALFKANGVNFFSGISIDCFYYLEG